MRKNVLLFAAAAAIASLATATPTPLASNPLVTAVHRGDCVAAVKLVNPHVSLNDQQTAFVAARMLDEGICVTKDPDSAAYFYSHAADLGDTNAALDYAAKVGLGVANDQNYEYAGNLCRAAGLDTQQKLSGYSLGYACTVRSVASELLRQSLPQGAFRPNTGSAVVAFSVGSGAINIRSTPEVGVETASTGSFVRKPLINASREIENAFHKALVAVPKPDASRLDGQIELLLDIDMTIEGGHPPVTQTDSRNFGTLQQGDMHNKYGPQ